MGRNSILKQAEAATDAFVRSLAPRRPDRIEAEVHGRDGMPVLRAVEAALSKLLPARVTHELVWLTRGPDQAHRLRLVAFGAARERLAEACHEFTP